MGAPFHTGGEGEGGLRQDDPIDAVADLLDAQRREVIPAHACMGEVCMCMCMYYVVSMQLCAISVARTRGS